MAAAQAASKQGVCGDHSGMCEAMDSCKRRITHIEVCQEKCEGDVVKFKLFYTLIGVLIVLFAGIFGMGASIKSEVGTMSTKMSTTLGIHGVQLEHVMSDVTDIKKRLP